MTLAEKKIELIRKISEMEDTQLLERIQEWLDFELDESVYQLSEEQTNRIEEAREEYKSGKILTEEEANTEIKKWLSEE